MTPAKLFDAKDADWALCHAAVHAWFAEADLASSWAAITTRDTPAPRRAGEDRSLTQGTNVWAALGTPATTAAVQLDNEQDVSW